MQETTISLEGINLVEFFGIDNVKFNILRRAFPNLRLIPRGSFVKAVGPETDIKRFRDSINRLTEFLQQHGSMTAQHVEELITGGLPLDLPKPAEDVILYGPNGVMIRAKTPNQRKMVELIEENDIMFAVGPAGTGKTYTAVALAVRALKNNLVKKIVLTRPAVEAGENLGFLPGDLKDKVDPYLRPLYDALDDMIPISKLNFFMTNRIIEIAPLAFMRGRTLDNSFIILDEAQNATHLQLKMFLTRLGPSAKSIITGDLTQIDLPRNQQSGLSRALGILQNINGIATIYLGQEDVLRHRLVKKIIKAYDRIEQSEAAAKEATKQAAKEAKTQSGKLAEINDQ